MTDTRADPDLELVDAEASGVGWPYRVGQMLVWPAILGALVGVGFIVTGLFQGGKINPGQNPSFVDTIFASRTVVGAARIVLLLGGIYVVASIFVLMSRNQWLTKVGPIEVSESTAGIAEERDALAAELRDTRELIDSLEERLAATSSAYQESSDLLRMALDRIDTLTDEKEGLE